MNMKRRTKKGLVQNLLSLVVVSSITTITSFDVANANDGTQQDPVPSYQIKCCKPYYDQYEQEWKEDCYSTRSSYCDEGYYQAIKIRKPSYLSYSNLGSSKAAQSQK